MTAPRKQRAIMATDSEWQVIRERAQAAGMPISRFIVERLTEKEQQMSALPASILRRMAREVLVLSRIEELRLSGHESADVWKAVGDEVDAWLDKEKRLG